MTNFDGLIVKSEKMGVSSHGLHYFIHSVYPLLKQGYEEFKVEQKGSMIYSYGSGGVGFKNLVDCLQLASIQSKNAGISLLSIKNPGKVGALRVYCSEPRRT